MSDEIKPDKIIYCFRHFEKEAVGACLGCGKPLCDICGEWFKSRFYCVNCYANVELLHAQSELVDIRQLRGYPAPQYLIALLFAALCSFIVGFGFFSVQRINYGIVLWCLSWLFLVASLFIIRYIKLFTIKIKMMLTILIWIGLLLLPILSLLLLLMRRE